MPEVKYTGQIDGMKSPLAKMFDDLKCPKCGKESAMKFKAGFFASYEPCKFCGEEWTDSKHNQIISENVE